VEDWAEIRRLYGDFDAVKAGLTLQWSSGKVEGNVTRVILWNQSCEVITRLPRPRRRRGMALGRRSGAVPI
jgi:hypothetical protein